MILQNIVFRMSINEPQIDELYYRGKIHVEEEGARLEAGGTLKTDTYMNFLDLDFWKEHTLAKDFQINLDVCGTGILSVSTVGSSDSLQIQFNCQDRTEVKAAIPQEWSGKLFFTIEALSQVHIYKGFYEASFKKEHPVKLAVIICTYRREKQLDKLLAELQKAKNYLKGSLKVNVVDNASELSMDLEKSCDINLYHNTNTGGSGGFSRGLQEVIKRHSCFAATHVLLMDDDVILEWESIFRLYALLSGIRGKYRNEIIAGRMFRLDQPWVQYTAAEIWNGGDIRHVGWNLDMTSQENLVNLNRNRDGNGIAEYSGWWFSCIPYDFVENNMPFPFFLHCDDVEYGLRHGGTPVVVNGIQVWHETYEYRKSPVTAYYDMRNSLMVNMLYGLLRPPQELYQWWKEKISEAHVEKDYQTELMMIFGMLDFLKGEKWLRNLRPEKHHKKVKRLSLMNDKFVTAIAWRFTELVYRINVKN